VDRQVDAGVNIETSGCQAAAPPVAVDGDLIAYVVEDASEAARAATKIVVRSISTGAIVREIKSDATVNDVDMAGGDVSYIEGIPSDVGDPSSRFQSTKLKLSFEDGSPERIIGGGVSAVSFSDGRIVFRHDRSEAFPDVLTTTTDDVLFAQDSVMDNQHELRSDPFAAGRFVSYPVNSGISIWDGQDDRTYGISPFPVEHGFAPGVVNATSMNAGWLVWASASQENGETVTRISGIPVSELPAIGE
jgi:hypothetical protein